MPQWRRTETVKMPPFAAPTLVWVNMLLTVSADDRADGAGLSCRCPCCSSIAFALALVINYPSLEEQKARIAANAGNALAVVVGDIRRRHLHRHPFRHQDGRCHCRQCRGDGAAGVRALSGRHHRDPEHAFHLLPLERRFLFWHPAHPQRKPPPTTESPPPRWRAPRSRASRCTCSVLLFLLPTCWWAWPRSSSATTRSSRSSGPWPLR
jgi:hypothetical protein